MLVDEMEAEIPDITERYIVQGWRTRYRLPTFVHVLFDILLERVVAAHGCRRSTGNFGIS